MIRRPHSSAKRTATRRAPHLPLRHGTLTPSRITARIRRLRVHLQDDSRRKLCSAGGWTVKTSTAEDYAGLTIEATRDWSRLMVRPVTLL